MSQYIERSVLKSEEKIGVYKEKYQRTKDKNERYWSHGYDNKINSMPDPDLSPRLEGTII